MQVLDTTKLMLTSPCCEPDADGRSTLPADREGHSASVVGAHIYVFGGTWTDDDQNTIYFNDLHRLDTLSLSWNRPPCVGAAPIEREGHTAVTADHRVFIFGGTWVDDDDNSIYLNDLHVLQTEGSVWSQPATTGEPPIPREGHTAAIFINQMVVFGGAGLDADERSVRVNTANLYNYR